MACACKKTSFFQEAYGQEYDQPQTTYTENIYQQMERNKIPIILGLTALAVAIGLGLRKK